MGASESAVFFSPEEIETLYWPFLYSIIAECSYGKPLGGQADLIF